MNRNIVVKGAGVLITLCLIAGSILLWILSESSKSYAKPAEALLAVQEDVVLIPAYKIDDESLYFFIKDHEQLGASYIHKGLFGWQAEHFQTSPFVSNVCHSKLNGYQGYGENLIYGIMTNGDERIVTLNSDVAHMINLEMLPTQIVEKYQLNGLYLWYIESDTISEKEGEIKLVNKYSEEVLDVVLK